MVGKYPRTHSIRAARRERAEAVQVANVRSPQEQLAKLNKLNLVAVKERLKIAQKLKQEAEAATNQKKSKKNA
jgi:hypothetical protein